MKRSLCSIPRRVTDVAESPALLRPRQCFSRRWFHASPRWLALKPFILADIGEGIREVQIIQWFVQPGARVEQFDKICEVASDKAIVEITSRYDGVIKKLHYEADAMAQVGKPLCDIDIQGDADPIDQVPATTAASKSESTPAAPESNASQQESQPDTRAHSQPASQSRSNGSNKAAHLATPAVRGLLKEHNLDITQIKGTGRDGRVLKDDIHNHLNSNAPVTNGNNTTEQATAPAPPSSAAFSSHTDATVSMSPIQAAMFKSMTRSLSIPHFLYSDEVDMTELSHVRTQVNTFLSSPLSSNPVTNGPFSAAKQPPISKVSYLPFIIKAVSLAINKHPILNATLAPQSQPSNNHGNGSSNSQPPKLLHRPSHNVGIAIDTPSGLLVPVIKNVQSLSVLEIAQHLTYLQSLASSNKLTSHPDLLSGGTITISNIGNIGGGVLSPVLVEGQSAILGIGKAKELPRFVGASDAVQRRLIANFSWTADHRVLDGATVARFAADVAEYVQKPAGMVVNLR